MDDIHRVGVFHDLMAGIGIPMYVGLGEPFHEIVQEHVREDDVLRSPQQKRRKMLQLRKPISNRCQRVEGRMGVFDRYVFDEVSDTCASCRGVIGRRIAAIYVAGHLRPGHAQRTVQKRGCQLTRYAKCCPSNRDQCGHLGGRRSGHARIHQHDTSHLVDVLLGPAHGDGSAPVVGHGDDRSLDLQGVRD